MREIFEDLMTKIKRRTGFYVDYVESDTFCGMEIFRFENLPVKPVEMVTAIRFVAKFGFEDGKLIMITKRLDYNIVSHTCNLCESGDPIKLIIEFIKKHVLTKDEISRWIHFDTEGKE